MPTLNYKGKPFVQNHHLAVPYHELIPSKSKSLTKKVSLHDNLIVHGDNLKALKALLPTYAGKVKCIYIDPPYNTGNEHWAYNDNVNSPMMQEWLGKVVDREDLTRHDKWLCMMTPRLKLLRELLREDGVIFVSIDDNEVAHLRMLMDEIFGENNFLTSIVWQKKYTQSNDAKYFSYTHDYILAFAKNLESPSFKMHLLERTEEQNARYTNPDKDPRGPWKAIPLHAKSGTSAKKVIFDNGRTWMPPAGTFNRYSVETIKRAEKEKRLYFGKSGQSVPVMKKFLTDVGGILPKSIWLYDEVGGNDSARSELKDLFPENPFETPKPSSLIKRLAYLTTEKEDIILDSFAGAGTTAHATLALNKEDGGNRKFVLVEMEDYADKITAERVRRVIKGVPKAKDEALKKGLGGTFSYFELGEPIELESILSGDRLPSFEELARYVFYTATGEEFDEKAVDAKRWFIGASKDFDVYLLYKPDLDYLKKTALTLEFARGLGKGRGGASGRRRLIFAPTKYLSQEHLDEFRIDFAQLPFEIYRLVK